MNYANMRRRHINTSQHHFTHAICGRKMKTDVFPSHPIRNVPSQNRCFDSHWLKISNNWISNNIVTIILANRSQRTHQMIYKCYQMKINCDMYELMMFTTSHQSTAHRHQSSFDQLSNVDQVKSGNYDVRKTWTLVLRHKISTYSGRCGSCMARKSISLQCLLS